MAVTNQALYNQKMQEYLQSVADSNAAKAKAGNTQVKAIAQNAGTTAATASTPNVYSYTPGDTLAGVSAGTKAQMEKYQAGYSPSDAVLDAQMKLAEIQNQKPQGYNSKYSAQLDSILQQIQNPEEFKWDFNGDELFRTYADIYSRKGQQAMMDTIGNASALTGGYGNSYATQVGQQTYDEYMNDLFGVGMDLRDRAYQMYQDKQQDLYNRYGVLQSADESDYGRYRDEVGDWQTMLDYYTGRADTERNFDYGTWQDMMNYWTNMAGMENQDYWTSVENAMQNAATMLQMGITPSMDLLLRAGYGTADAQKIMAAYTAVAGGSSGGGGGGGSSGKSNESNGSNGNTGTSGSSNLQAMIDALAINQAMGINNVMTTQMANNITQRLADLNKYTGKDVINAIGNPVLDYKKTELANTMANEPVGNTDTSKTYVNHSKDNKNKKK